MLGDVREKSGNTEHPHHESTLEAFRRHATALLLGRLSASLLVHSRSFHVRLDKLFAVDVVLRRRTMTTAIRSGVSPAAEDTVAVVVFTLIGTRKMHIGREG